MTKIEEIKQVVAKIDLEKITSYSQEYPKSQTLKQIIKYSKATSELDSQEEEKTFKLAVKLGYNLDTICDPEKLGCVKNEEEKKYWLGISRELFENTIGVKDKK